MSSKTIHGLVGTAMFLFGAYALLEQIGTNGHTYHSTLYDIAGLICLFVGYFYPTIIAVITKNSNKITIILINVLTGWFWGIGWLVAMIMALKGAEPKKTCPSCAETILKAAKICRHCGEKLIEQPV